MFLVLLWNYKTTMTMRAPSKKKYNFTWSCCKLMIEYAFDRQKARWHCLHINFSVIIGSAIQIFVMHWALYIYKQKRKKRSLQKWEKTLMFCGPRMGNYKVHLSQLCAESWQTKEIRNASYSHIH